MIIVIVAIQIYNRPFKPKASLEFESSKLLFATDFPELFLHLVSGVRMLSGQ